MRLRFQIFLLTLTMEPMLHKLSSPKTPSRSSKPILQCIIIRNHATNRKILVRKWTHLQVINIKPKCGFIQQIKATRPSTGLLLIIFLKFMYELLVNLINFRHFSPQINFFNFLVRFSSGKWGKLSFECTIKGENILGNQRKENRLQCANIFELS